MGSPLIGAAIAQVLFWLLVVSALVGGRPRLAVLFSIFWIAGRLALNAFDAGGFFTPLVAVLDIALVLLLVGRDIRLT
jgi:hypothetical protein